MSFEDFSYPTVLKDLHLPLQEHDLYSDVASLTLDPGFIRRLGIGSSLAFCGFLECNGQKTLSGVQDLLSFFDTDLTSCHHNRQFYGIFSFRQ